jgi:ATP-dependent DNA ligase
VQRQGLRAALPALVSALEPLPNETVIDGEIVALDESGRLSFNLLQNHAMREYALAFYPFDLLILAGEDLRNEPLKWTMMYKGNHSKSCGNERSATSA